MNFYGSGISCVLHAGCTRCYETSVPQLYDRTSAGGVLGLGAEYSGGMFSQSERGLVQRAKISVIH